MKTKDGRRRRRGAVMAEAAIVYSVTITLVMGTIVVGLGIFRYQQIAWLAREGARWASVRGTSKYQTEQSKAEPTAADVVAGAVTPRMAALDPIKLTATLTWDKASTPPTLTFKLSYQWTPELVLAPLTFSSSATQPITY
ncbi:pilus assembly protein [Isosphaeraceae bacterium EP7]